MESVYQDNDEKPVIAPDLKRQEGISSNNAGNEHVGATSSTGGGSFKYTPGKEKEGEGNFANRPALGKMENNDQLSNSATASGKLSSSIIGSTPQIEVIKTFLKKHKKGAAAGGAGGVSLILLIMGFGFLVNYELKTIEKDLVKYEAKVEQKFEKTAAKEIYQHLICRALDPASHPWLQAKCNKGDEGDDKDSTESEDDANGALEEAMDNFDITSPDVVNALEKNGIKVNVDSEGKFTGLTDANTGDPITTEDIANNTNGAFDNIENALPEWDVGQVTSFVPEMETHAGADFDILSDTGDENADKEIQDEVTFGDEGGQLSDVVADENNGEPPKDATAAEKQAFSDNGVITGQTAAAVNATLEAENKGESEADAIKAGEEKFDSGGGDGLLVGQVLSDACDVEEAANAASKARVPEIMSLLIRHATTIMSLASQLTTGKITAKALGQVMKLFNGNPSLPSMVASSNQGKSVKLVRNSAALPFSASASWQRITGNPVNTDSSSSNYTPDIDESSKPVANSGTHVVNEVDSIIGDIPGGNLTCSALTSPFGGIIQGFLGAVQIVADGFSFGAAQLATMAAGIGVQEALQNIVIPDILRYFTPIGLDGIEDSVQWMNNADAGANLAFNNYSQSLGAQPATNAVADQQYALATNAENSEEARESFGDKVFAFDNPNSLVAHLALEIPIEKNVLVSDMVSYFTTLPSHIMHDLASLIDVKAFADNNTQNPGTPYGITQYDFPDPTKYDPIENEAYLNSSITYNGVTKTRLSLLGDPNTYNNSNPDSSTQDVLHCFLQGYTSTADQTTGSNDQICGSVGSYDYNNDTPQPITDTNVAISYCEQFGVSGIGIPGCVQSLLPQMNDDIGHFTQYILDTHVMSDYTSLTSNSSGSS